MVLAFAEQAHTAPLVHRSRSHARVAIGVQMLALSLWLVQLASSIRLDRQVRMVHLVEALRLSGGTLE